MTAFIDTTLRDGLQSPGVFLSRSRMLETARGLLSVGFTELEGGIPVRGEEDSAFMGELAGLGFRVISWCRAREGDLEAAERSQTGAVHISGTLSDRMLAVLGEERSSMEERLLRLVERARGCFAYVSAGLMDAVRTPADRLVSLVGRLTAAGADRIRLADTVGTATPVTIQNWAGLLGPYLPRVEFHGHNDLGMATANAWCAVHCGFGAVSGTLGGIGERAGNTSWDELFPALAVSGEVLSGIDLPALLKLSADFRKVLGEEIPPRQPILGSMAFAHESGIHVNGIRKDPKSFQCVDPAEWGLPPARILYGSQSGPGALESCLDEAGQTPTPEELAELLPLVTEQSRRDKRPLGFSDVLTLYNTMRRRQEYGSRQP